MDSTRSISRWTLTALVINSIIGSGIYGVQTEVIRLVGYASPAAMMLAALVMAIVILPVAEVASQFSEPGGMYLYARTTFGRFVGLQVGWFWLLAIVGGGAAGTNLFLTYLARFLPVVDHGWPRVVALVLLIAIPALANYVGVRQGAVLSVVLTLAKLLPIALVIALGLIHGSVETTKPAAEQNFAGWSAWLGVLLILLYSYSGWEDALVPAGEVQEPRRAIPFSLAIGFLFCAAVYTLLQLVVLRTVGTTPTNYPVADAASVLMGKSGSVFVSVAIMISSYGWISGAFLSAPRLAVSLARNGDCAPVFGRLHPRFRTPTVGIVLFAVAVGVLAGTGTFLWAIAVTAGSLAVFYAVSCAALIRLRQVAPETSAFRAPLGRVFAMLGIVICAGLLTQLQARQIALMSVTALIATANWWLARRNAWVLPYREAAATRNVSSPPV